MNDAKTTTSTKIDLTIEGGHELHGTVETNTSKNGAVALLCASLLNRGTTTLHHVPKIEEVYRIIEVLESIGCAVTWNERTVHITPPKEIEIGAIDRATASVTRACIMLIGPLLQYFKDFHIPQSGGCDLGDRVVRPHFFALEPLGVSVEATADTYHVTHSDTRPAEIVLYESGDTVTENVIMAAAATPGTTIIKYASSNYMVQELCVFLKLLGITIEGIGTTTLTVHGSAPIETDVEYTLAEDPTDAMFFIAAAVVTNSSITITRAPIEFLELELLKLEKMGFQYEASEPYLAHNGFTKLVDITTHPSTLTAVEEKIYARPYPGLNIDNLPFFVVIATQAKGNTLVHDWVYNGRAVHYTELNRLRADIFLADPHRVYITGPTQLRATSMDCPPALRPAAILLIGMLGARGTSELRDIYMINRGYQNIAERLASLGAHITSKVSDAS